MFSYNVAPMMLDFPSFKNCYHNIVPLRLAKVRHRRTKLW